MMMWVHVRGKRRDLTTVMFSLFWYFGFLILFRVSACLRVFWFCFLALCFFFSNDYDDDALLCKRKRILD